MFNRIAWNPSSLLRCREWYGSEVGLCSQSNITSLRSPSASWCKLDAMYDHTGNSESHPLHPHLHNVFERKLTMRCRLSLPCTRINTPITLSCFPADNCDVYLTPSQNNVTGTGGFFSAAHALFTIGLLL